jgi:arylsulfatase
MSNITEKEYPGQISNEFCTVMDVVPTILEYAELAHPGTQYKGREIAPLKGRSWVKYLDFFNRGAARTELHGEQYVMGFEIAGSGALRRGDWKITFVPAPKGPQKWELFNIREDPGEIHDLAEQDPTRLAEMLILWEEYKAEVGVVGVAGEYPDAIQGDPKTSVIDEMEDPYCWIKYIGRPEITPDRLKGVMPQVH